jgi:site-specific DNA recombinase
MNKSQSKTKYILYARKSTESEDKQILSIDSQITELKRIAVREKLQIVDVLSESRSAKTLGRPVFEEMIKRIGRGEATGILCWKLDRLARNFSDGGNIIEMLQQSTIQHIRSYERDYYPNDNVLLMSVEFGMANQYSRDLAVNVARGMRRKVEMGWYPVRPALGYLNSKTKGKGNNDIMNDPERFDLVRKIWDFALKGTHTIPQILELATNEWGLRNREGNKIAKSTIYYMLTNSFYYGMFEWPKGSGNWYQGKHEPMISIDEYDKVQILLGRKGKPRPKRHTFTFIGTMKCGECGASITAEEKNKVQQNGNVHHYIYYRCTKHKVPKCTQKTLEEKKLIEQIDAELAGLTIPDSFHKWAMKWFEKENQSETKLRTSMISQHRQAYNKSLKLLDRYIEMRAHEELTEEEFREKKGQALKEKARLNALLNDSDNRVTNWAETMDQAFKFVKRAKEKFENGTPEEKRQIFLALGSNPSITFRKLFIDMEKPLIPTGKLALEVQAIHKRLEPRKSIMSQGDYEQIYAHSPIVSPH